MAMPWSTEHDVAEHRDLQATSMAVDSNGQYALLAGRKYLALISLDKPKEVMKLVTRQSKWEINTAEWNPHPAKENLFALACNQRAELIVFREGQFQSVHNLRAHTRVIGDLNWSPFDPNLLATCSVDNYTYIWDIRDARRPAISLFSIAGASQVKWNRVTGTLLATANEGDVRLWDHRMSNSPKLYLAAHTKKILGLDWSPNQENQFATASQECTVRFWDIVSQRKVENINTLSSQFPVWRARYTPFGDGLISVVVPQLRRGENNSLFLWNITNLSSAVHTFVGHTDVVLEFAWRKPSEVGDNRNYQLVTWSKDGSLRIWRIDSHMQKLCGHDVDLMEASDQDFGVTSDLPDAGDAAEAADAGDAADVEGEASQLSQLSLGATGGSTIPKPHSSQGSKTDEKAEADSPLHPRTLQQEFSLVNVNIPNVTVEEMDATKRSCTITAKSGKSVVRLQMQFPPLYPIDAAPTFQFCKGTSLDNNTKTQLATVLKTMSLQHVKRNQSCLEPCLRQLKTTLESCSASEQETENSGAYGMEAGASSFLPPTNHYGSFQDVTVPFPRTSGASFCGAGYLVRFSRPLHLKRMSNPGEVTPRSLSALVAYASNTLHSNQSGLIYPSVTQSPSGETGVSVSSYYYQDRRHRSRTKSSTKEELPATEQKLSKTSRIIIYDVSALTPIHRELAQIYCLSNKNIPATCMKNASAAATVGRKDLVQIWSILSQTAEAALAVPSDRDKVPWVHTPFGRQMVLSIMDHYIKVRDIQTVAMICCIFGTKDKQQQNNALTKKTPRVADSAVYTHFTGKSWLKPGGSPYHTIHPGDTLDGFTLSTLLKTSRSNSWSDSLDDHSIQYGATGGSNTRDYRETDFEKHDVNSGFLDPKQNFQYDQFKKSYAEILYQWNLLQSRTHVLKFLTCGSEEHIGVDFITECQYCERKVNGAFCERCKNYSFQCAICHVAVKGASSFCLICGHGGHALHMMDWFAEFDYCPVGCGCNCLSQSDIFG